MLENEQIIWSLTNKKKRYNKRYLKRVGINPYDLRLYAENKFYEEIYILTNQRFILKSDRDWFNIDAQKHSEDEIGVFQDIAYLTLDSLKVVHICPTENAPDLGFTLSLDKDVSKTCTYIGFLLTFENTLDFWCNLKKIVPLPSKPEYDKFKWLLYYRKA